MINKIESMSEIEDRKKGVLHKLKRIIVILDKSLFQQLLEEEMKKEGGE